MLAAGYLHDAFLQHSKSPELMGQGEEWEILGERDAERIVK